MQQIFTETSEPITGIVIKFYNEEIDRVVTTTIDAQVTTTAHYDAEMCVLVVDQECVLSLPYWKNYLRWAMHPRRTLETSDLHSQATRRAIQLADEYEDRLSKTVFDDDRSDDEVRASEA